MHAFEPFRRRPVAWLNAFLGASGRLGRAALDEASLVAAARRRAGLDDFGDDAFRAPLGVLLEALDDTARLHPVGRWMVRDQLVSILVNRLRHVDALRREPAIAERPVERPIVVAGLQRTGTTMLHRLLAADPRLRFLVGWEALNPAPLPRARPAAGGEDPRVAAALRAERGLRYLAPDFFAIHPIGAREPEEEVLLLNLTFHSTAPEAMYAVPAFSRWLEGRSHVAAYRTLRSVLQHLDGQRARAGRPTGRWVLKTPHHLEHLDALFEVFPDATVVQTHRDPARVLASFCSMVAHARAIFSDEVDAAEIGRHWLRKQLRMVERAAAVRDERGGRSFVDVLYQDTTTDPAGVLRRLYEALDLDFGPADAARVAAWRDANPQHKHGRHRYRLEDWGLAADEVAAAFAGYRERFAIPEEP